MSNLSAFPYIAERSEGTPGLWNYPLSIISANIAAIDSGLTSSSPSGNTFSFLTNIETSGGAHFQFLSVGSTPPSYVTTAAITVRVNSGTSDYLYLTDSSALRSSYVIGSRAGGLADGLNIWDASAGTMIASFSKQSIRFFQNVVGPVFDLGGALTGTYNAATFGTGSQSTESRIQAAINQAAIDVVERVYIPSSMYPYSASSVSFINTVQMVREGGNWTNFDVLAYGAHGDGQGDDRLAFRGALDAAGQAGGGIVYVPVGTFNCGSTTHRFESTRTVCLEIPSRVLLVGASRTSSIIKMASTCTNQTVLIHNARSDTPDDRDITIENLTLDLNRSSFSTVGGWDRMSGIVTNRVTNLTIRGVRIANQFGTTNGANGPNGTSGEAFAIGPTAPRGLVVDNCETTDAGAISAFGNPSDLALDVRISNCISRRAIQLGYTVFDADRVTYVNCSASSMSFYGWGIEGSRNVSLVGCHASLSTSTNAHGFAVFSGSAAISFAGCTASNNSGHGYAIFPGSSSADWLSPSGATTIAGPFLSGVLNVSFAGGMALFNAQFGVLHSSGSIAGVLPTASGNLGGQYSITTANTHALLDPRGHLLTQGVDATDPNVIMNRGNNQQWMIHLDSNDFSIRDATASADKITILHGLQGPITFARPLQVGNDSLATPGYMFASEVSLGFYRSGASTVALSKGTLVATEVWATSDFSSPNIKLTTGDATTPAVSITRAGGTQLWTIHTDNNVWTLRDASASRDKILVNTGTLRTTFNDPVLVANDSATTPGYAFNSDGSLGWYRSGISTLALSYGTINLTSGGAVTSIASLTVKSGTNNSCGTAVLGSNGSVNVANTYVKTGDLIFLTDQTAGGTLGDLEIGGIRNSSGFTILSTSLTDTSTVAWLIIRPG